MQSHRWLRDCFAKALCRSWPAKNSGGVGSALPERARSGAGADPPGAWQSGGRRGSAPSQMRLLVAIDQMEELFTTEKEPAIARSACAAPGGVRRQRTGLGDRDDPIGFLSPLRRSPGLLGAEGRPRQLRALAADRPGDRPDHPRAGARRRAPLRGERRSGAAR